MARFLAIAWICFGFRISGFGFPATPAGPPAAVTTNVLGLLLPPEEPETGEVRDGASLAIHLANRDATHPVELHIRGRAGQWGADAVEAARMATDEEAVGLIAPTDGGATHLALQVAGKTVVPVISLCADSSVTRTGVPWMVRIVPRTLEEAQTVLAGLRLRAAASPLRVVAVVPDGRAGREIARDLEQAGAAIGYAFEKIIRINPDEANPKPVTAEVQAVHPEAVLLWLPPKPAGRLATGLRQGGFRGAFAGPGRLRSPAFLAAAGQAAESILLPAIVLEKESPAMLATFEAAFSERYHRPPSWTAAMSYDAAMLLVRRVRDSRAAPLSRAFPTRFSYAGVTGQLCFDAEGNRQVALCLWTVHHGQFVPMAPKR